MKMVKPSPTLGKNAFDMSYRSLFSAKFGELLPAYIQETVPNDTFHIRPADLIRALPMVTSPFLRAKQHIDFWFVPYSAMWSRFNEFMVDKTEKNSSALNDRDFLPHFDLRTLYQRLSLIGDNDYTDIAGLSYKKGAFKLLNMLGYGSSNAMPDLNLSVNPFRLLAYNYIWYKEYRQQYYDDGTYLFRGATADKAAYLFNADFLDCSTADFAEYNLGSSSTDFAANSYLFPMCQMRYRTWKKDLYTGLLPSTQFGNVAGINIDDWNFTLPLSGRTSSDVNRWYGMSPDGTPVVTQDNNYQGISGLGQLKAKQSDGTVTSMQHTHALDGISLPLSLRNMPGFDILSLRKSEAVQKWRENALRAGNQIEDNFEAHYGSKPRTHLISHPTFIGSYDAQLNIGDIEATAQTGAAVNGQVGDITGKGITSLDGHEIKFSTNDFGVIIGMFSMLPDAEYNAIGINRMNSLLEREDFFIPEYENLGLAPVGSENFTLQSSFDESGQPLNSNFVLGYAPRYWEYKQRLDEVHNSFMNFPNGTNAGEFRAWAAPKYDVANFINDSPLNDLSTLYVNPRIYDSMFGVSAANTDQFLVDMFFDASAVRSMSVSGMPSY